MREILAQSLSAKLGNLTAELRLLDRGLKSNLLLDGTALREFRQALDNVRMTAWTVNEMLNAHQTRKDPHAVLSFLTAERLRRFSEMAQDLSGDFDREGATWPVQAVKDLEDSLTLLSERLRLVGEGLSAGKGA